MRNRIVLHPFSWPGLELHYWTIARHYLTRYGPTDGSWEPPIDVRLHCPSFGLAARSRPPDSYIIFQNTMSRFWVGQLSAMRPNTLLPMAIVIQTGCRESQDMRGT